MLSRKGLNHLNVSMNEAMPRKNHIAPLFSPMKKPFIIPPSPSNSLQPRVSLLKGKLRRPIRFDSISINFGPKAIRPDFIETILRIPKTTKAMNQHLERLKESKSCSSLPLLSREYSVEDFMKRKIRFRIQKTSDCRPCAEYSPDFYKQGGLITGSTNIQRDKSVSLLSKSALDTLDLQLKILDSKKIWKNKVKNELLLRDKQYVLNLKP